LPLPRITIVTPSFRAEQFIQTTIESVLGQGYPDLEYIILDGAGDDTASILQRYDDQLAFWRSAPDAGQYAAINEGFARATGEILCWLNADDMLLPRALFVVGEIFAQHPGLEWVSTIHPAIFDANANLAKVGRLPGFNKQAFLDGLFLPGTQDKGFWIQQESTFFRRSLWQRAGGRIPDYPLAGDFALWCEFYKHADLVAVEYPLSGFRMLEGQRSGDLEQYLREGAQALQRLREHVGHPSRRVACKTDFYPGRIVMNTARNRIGAPWHIVDHEFAAETDLPLW